MNTIFYNTIIYLTHNIILGNSKRNANKTTFVVANTHQNDFTKRIIGVRRNRKKTD